MMTSSKGSVFRLLFWQRRSVLLFTLSSIVAVIFFKAFGFKADIPVTPLAIMGGVLGIFVSFRTNSAYDRWWEGRKLWGRMINTSRQFTVEVMAYIGESDSERKAISRDLVMRHIAYVHVLRSALRAEDPRVDEDVIRTLEPEEMAEFKSYLNLNQALLGRQLEDIRKLESMGILDALKVQSFDLSIRELFDIQGGCERIKKTPMPPGYAFIAERLILGLSVLFPLSLIAEMGWWVVPMNVILCLSFALVSEAGRVLEDPFSHFWNGLPLLNISRMIEVNLRQDLGDRNLPEIPGPNAQGVVM